MIPASSTPGAVGGNGWLCTRVKNETYHKRADCVVPEGTSGQSCGASAGELCNPCNPLNPECVEPDARCVVTNAHETCCGRDCSTQGCPADYQCMTVKLQVGHVKQCIPLDLSCYF